MCGDNYQGINSMSGLQTARQKRPEEKLSELLKSAADTQISPTVLKLFIAAHWSKVSKLAHEIHEGAR